MSSNEKEGAASELGSAPEETHHGTLKRQKRGKGRAKKSGMTWDTVQIWGWGVLLFFVALFLLNPWRWFVVDDAQQVLGEGRTLYWLAYENGSLVIGGLLGLATAVWGFSLLRDNLNNRTSLHAKACPRCASTHLKRLRRTKLNRFLCLWGIPSYRYICADCKWQGSRIDHTRLRK